MARLAFWRKSACTSIFFERDFSNGEIPLGSGVRDDDVDGCELDLLVEADTNIGSDVRRLALVDGVTKALQMLLSDNTTANEVTCSISRWNLIISYGLMVVMR